MTAMTADDVVRELALRPHPEGGFFREIFRDSAKEGRRGAATSIYFLLRGGEVSAWHRVDAVEIWSFHAGAPLRLSVADEGGEITVHTLGAALDQGERPQAIVPAGAWQSAESCGDWTLVGCAVAPAFRFEGFDLAPEGWTPG